MLNKNILVKKSICLITLILVALLATSSDAFSQCYISKDSLTQLTKISGSEKHIFVKGNDIKSVSCVEKSGKSETIMVDNRTGIRIFMNDKSTKSFYFNTILLTDSTISGSKTHFFSAQIKPIPLDSISKIQIMK
jgi:hypothetical protein